MSLQRERAEMRRRMKKPTRRTRRRFVLSERRTKR